MRSAIYLLLGSAVIVMLGAYFKIATRGPIADVLLSIGLITEFLGIGMILYRLTKRLPAKESRGS